MDVYLCAECGTCDGTWECPECHHIVCPDCKAQHECWEDIEGAYTPRDAVETERYLDELAAQRRASDE